MDPLYKALVGSFVRWGLAMLTTWLVRHQVLTTDLATQASERLATDVLVYAPAAIALAWSLVHKWRTAQAHATS